MPRKPEYLLILIFMLLPFSRTVGQPDSIDFKRLLEGEILVEKINDAEGRPGIRASFTIAASRDELWGMLTDYENFNRIYGGIDSLNVFSEDKQGAFVEIFQSVKIRQIHFTLKRNYSKPGHSLSWERVSGDMKYIKGYWEILDTAIPGTHLVIYTNYFKYGGMIPTRITRNWAMKEVAVMAENSRQWIRENRHLYR